MSRILIIEDQSEIRRLIRWSLELEQHEMFEATNGAAGLKAAQTLGPDLILLDVMMPGELDGFQVCERIRADPVLCAKPVVILTARAHDRDRDASERAGADGYLAKPFSPAELVKMVQRLLAAPPRAGAVPAALGNAATP